VSVYIKGAYYGVVHLSIGRNNLNGKFWSIVNDEETTLKTFEEFGLRFNIKEGFLDDQSSGIEYPVLGSSR